VLRHTATILPADRAPTVRVVWRRAVLNIVYMGYEVEGEERRGGVQALFVVVYVLSVGDEKRGYGGDDGGILQHGRLSSGPSRATPQQPINSVMHCNNGLVRGRTIYLNAVILNTIVNCRSEHLLIESHAKADEN